MKKICGFLCLFALTVSCQSKPFRGAEPEKPIQSEAVLKDHSHSEATGSNFAVATQGIKATEAAQKIFQQGGNIIDAAVAASFVISVERPQSTGLGGGGFLLFHEASTGKDYAVDFRERAPLKATRDMYLKKDGTPDDDLSQNGILAVGVPGVVAGLCEVHTRFGKLPLAKVMQPAIDLAEKGFPVTPYLSFAMKESAEVLARDPEASRLFLDPSKKAWTEGHLIVQKDLARTLRLIAREGSKVFYRGKIADALVNYSNKHKGLLTKDDLRSYRVIWRKPVRGSFHGYDIVSMSPPSSGGIHVIQFLQFLEKDDLKSAGPLSAKALHLAASSLQDAFADRARYLGDPDFVKIPVTELLSPAYAAKRRQATSLLRARKADQVQAGEFSKTESTDTTHLSLMDKDGNAVSTTQTVNGYFGASIVVPGTGILLNNEMDDFAAKAGASNMFGAVGGEPNLIAPKKTPLSSMSPTFLVRDGKVQMALGAPGGTRIISCVAQTILNRIEFGLPLFESISTVRYHHQWRPDQLDIEKPGPRPEVLNQLKDLGYNVKIIDRIPCHVMAVAREDDKLHAVSEPRDVGTSAAH